MDGRADLRHQVEQRIRRGDERVRAARGPAPGARLRRGRAGRARRGRMHAARIRRHESAGAGEIDSEEEFIASPRPYPRIAQNSIEAREFAGEMESETAGACQLLPQVAALVDLEIRMARVIRDLPWRDRQLAHRDARQLQLHEIADPLDRPELRLRGKPCTQAVGRHVRAHREHEAGRVAQRRVGQRRDADAVARIAQLDLDRVLLEHRRQRPAQLGHQLREARAQVVVHVDRKRLRAPAGRRERAQVAGELQPVAEQRLRGASTQPLRVPGQREIAVHELQQQEIRDLRHAAAPPDSRAASASLRCVSSPWVIPLKSTAGRSRIFSLRGSSADEEVEIHR